MHGVRKIKTTGAACIALVAAIALGGCHRGGMAAMTPRERARLVVAEAAQDRQHRLNAIPLQYRRAANDVAMTSIIRRRLGATAVVHPEDAQIYRNGTQPGAYRKQLVYTDLSPSDLRARGLNATTMAALRRMHPTMDHGHRISWGPDGAPIVR